MAEENSRLRLQVAALRSVVEAKDELIRKLSLDALALKRRLR